MKKSERKELYYRHFDLAQDLYNKHLYKDAIKEYEEAAKIMPDESLSFHNAGITYYALGDIKNSIKYLKKSYKMEPDNQLTAINLGCVYYKQKKYSLAVKYFKNGILSHNAEDYVYNYFCDALYRLGKYTEASKYLKLAVDKGNIDTNIHLMLIDTFIKIENFEEAQSLLKLVNLSDKNALKIYQQKKLITDGQEYVKKIKLKNKKQIQSLCEYIEEINKIKENGDETYIYRGQNNKYLPLIPSLYRKKSYIENENNIIQDFNLKAEAFLNQELETFDDVDKIALMQHYGVPTRLLDFTESPLIALFFSLEKLSSESYNAAPCVYAINTKAFSHNSNGLLLTSKQIASKGINRIKGLCAFSPKLKSKRLTAQKGVFVLFNQNKPLELSIKEDNIIKIEIERECINKIKQELNNIGITPSIIYPDFTGLAEEIKTPHKFIEGKFISDIGPETFSSKHFSSQSFNTDDINRILSLSPSHS